MDIKFLNDAKFYKNIYNTLVTPSNFTILDKSIWL